MMCLKTIQCALECGGMSKAEKDILMKNNYSNGCNNIWK